jgi:ABC-type Co2+ transport system permease subunit
VRFQEQRLRAGFADSGVAMRLLAFGLWWVTAVGATVVVAVDHGPLLDAIGYRRTRFVRDVFRDFAKVAAAMLLNRRVATYDTRTDG